MCWDRKRFWVVMPTVANWQIILTAEEWGGRFSDTNLKLETLIFPLNAPIVIRAKVEKCEPTVTLHAVYSAAFTSLEQRLG